MTPFLSSILLIVGALRLMSVPSDFTEQEIFQALSWSEESEADARAAARMLSGGMDKELGVREDSPSVPTFSDDFLLILSLVSDEARVKAENHFRERPTVTPSDVEAWHRKRVEVRNALVSQGKIRE
jgi:hypothetical protein